MCWLVLVLFLRNLNITFCLYQLSPSVFPIRCTVSEEAFGAPGSTAPDETFTTISSSNYKTFWRIGLWLPFIYAFPSRLGCLLKAVTVSSSSCIPFRSLGTWLIFATSSSARLSAMALLWSKNNFLLSSHCDWCLCTIGVNLFMTPWHNGGAILSIVFLTWATYNPMGMHQRRDVRFPQECVSVPVMCVYCVGHLLCILWSRG